MPPDRTLLTRGDARVGQRLLAGRTPHCPLPPPPGSTPGPPGAGTHIRLGSGNSEGRPVGKNHRFAQGDAFMLLPGCRLAGWLAASGFRHHRLCNQWLAQHGEMPTGVHSCKAVRKCDFCSSPIYPALLVEFTPLRRLANGERVPAPLMPAGQPGGTSADGGAGEFVGATSSTTACGGQRRDHVLQRGDCADFGLHVTRSEREFGAASRISWLNRARCGERGLYNLTRRQLSLI